MKYLYLIILLTFTIKNYSQISDIKYIHLRNHNSSVIHSNLDIYIFHQPNNSVDVFVKTHNGEKKYSISNEKLLNLSNAILKINPKDVMQDVRNCLDAGETEIEFSSISFLPQNTVKYSVSCLSSKDKETEWKDFFNSVNLILEVAKLKFSDLK